MSLVALVLPGARPDPQSVAGASTLGARNPLAWSTVESCAAKPPLRKAAMMDGKLVVEQRRKKVWRTEA
jgi:hypothetical protein